MVDRYVAMRDALNKTGRPILFSLCEWGVADPWLWAQKARTNFDPKSQTLEKPCYLRIALVRPIGTR